MLTELAHYLFIFAGAVFGLETLILSPSLHAHAAAVSVRLGFRGVCLGALLLFAAFGILIYDFAVRDFSVAIVFETSSGTLPASFIPASFLSSREGFFFLFLLVFCVCTVAGYLPKPHTYVERGRYLFSCAAVLFLMTVLAGTTANPFVRVADPPLEGVALNPLWSAPYLSLKTAASVAAFAVLLTVFIKAVCQYSKGWHFSLETLTGVAVAAGLMLSSLSLGVCAGFLELDVPSLNGWESSETLLLAGFLMTLAFGTCLYLSAVSKAFSVWALVFGILATAIMACVFFAREYSLFSLKLNKAYFPNPVIAFCSVSSLISLLMFCFCSFFKKPLDEGAFALISRETFLGFAAVCCAVFGSELAVFSFLPVLQVFSSETLWQNFPAYFKAHALIYLYAFAFFVSAAVCVSLTTGKLKKIRRKLLACYGVFLAAVFGVLSFYLREKTGSVFLRTLPAVLIFGAVLNALNFKIAPVPQTVRALFSRLAHIRTASYGAFAVSFGFFVFSLALGAAMAGKTQAVYTPDPTVPTVIGDAVITFPAAEKTQMNALSEETVSLSDLRRRPLTVKVLNPSLSRKDDRVVFQAVFTDFPNTVVLKLRRSDDGEWTCFVTAYPFLRLLYAGFFALMAGVALFYVDMKRKSRR